MISRQHSSPTPSGPADAAAEAVLIEHYPRLVRLAHLVLPPSVGRHRRVLTAHGLVQRALPRGRSRRPDGTGDGSCTDAAYAGIRARVLRAALAVERPRRLGPWQLRPLPLRPGVLPRVFGLRLLPSPAGADELALEQALSGLSAAGRAAYVLRGAEGLPDAEVNRLLLRCGVPEPVRALAEADRVAVPAGSRDQPLLDAPGFDACLLRARPTDLVRRRQHSRAVLAAVLAVVVCGGLLGLPGGSWGPEGAAAPRYARNAASEAALDPGRLARAEPYAWRTSARVDFTVWPARGDRTGDAGLLRRALAVWARPGPEVALSVTRGTPAGPPAGPPRLLYAGRTGDAHVVLLYQGGRIARYAEPAGARAGGASLDLARTDLAGMAGSSAVVLSREAGNVRYLTAPWVTSAAVADLRDPSDEGRRVRRGADGATTAQQAAGTGRCPSRQGLLLRAAGRGAPYLFTDLGELTPARLTDGPPRGVPSDATGPAARARLARSACELGALGGTGVKSVNLWRYARQTLPGGSAAGTWVCLRAETWRGGGARVRTALHTSSAPPSAAAAPAAQAAQAAQVTGSPACGPRDARVLSGVRWKAPSGRWYVLAAGSGRVTSVRAEGAGVRAAVRGRALAVPAPKDVRIRLTGRAADGRTLAGLGQSDS